MKNEAPPGIRTLQPAEVPRILFLARYAPAATKAALREPRPGHYPRYHREIYETLIRMGLDVVAADHPDALSSRSALEFGYVFCLFNRIKMRHSEVFVSSVCEYMKIPYLGAQPQIRGLAEDKKLAKILASSLGMRTPPSQSYDHMTGAHPPPGFAGPYFVKPRFGAASENLSDQSLQETWAGAAGQVEALLQKGVDALVERYIPGFNITVPVLADSSPLVLPPVESVAPNDTQVLTEDLKLQDEKSMRFRLASDRVSREQLGSFARKLFELVSPIDYFRMDYRIDRNSGEPNFLEFNICCDISSTGSLMFSAKSTGLSHQEVLGHVLAYSLARQRNLREHLKGIL